MSAPPSTRGATSLSRAVAAARSVVRLQTPERDPVERRLRRVASIADLRAIARRMIPRAVFDYIDGGAEDERTMAANCAGFETIRFVPRVLRDVGDVAPGASLLGRPATIPLILAPTGLSRIASGDGELAVARAAASAGIPYTLSTVSSCSIEAVAATGGGDRWFQLYVGTDHRRSEALLHRAAVAGYRVLVVTVDSAAIGKRERDIRRGLVLPPTIGLGTLVDGIVHPRWTIDFLRHGPIGFANLPSGADRPGRYSPNLRNADLSAFDLDPRLTWRDLDWIRAAWPGPIVLKGIQSVADARMAAESGVAAIALSNHGGRQLDGAISPIDLVAPVADAVGGRLEIYCDGGVRRGGDVVKAVALGATACMVGRPYLYGLAAGGQRGVARAIAILDDEIRRTLRLVGAASWAEVDRDLLALGRCGP